MQSRESRRREHRLAYRFLIEQRKALADAKIPDGLYRLKIVNYGKEYTFTARPDQMIDGYKIHTVWVLADGSDVPPGPIGEILSVERIGE
jgi:hypothetical protein